MNKKSESLDSSSTGSVMHATSELLTKEECQTMETMARVRKDAWVNRVKVLFFGSLFGMCITFFWKNHSHKTKGCKRNHEEIQ